ncbi:MAG TPA: hypothetical protein VGS19_05475 [Streptosporangiaceae bacterium]|nr:hypothetical protein [Streptosporangiaceae bacterium]
MDADTAALVRVYLGLTPAQQDEAAAIISEYSRGDSQTRERIARECGLTGSRRIDVGPVTNGPCPLCGR